MNMATRPQMTEAQRLQRIRDGLEAIAPGEWTRAADDLGEFVEVRDEHGVLVNIARFQPGASLDEITFIASAPETVRFLLGLVDRAIVALREKGGQAAAPKGEGPKDFAAEAAMKCAEPAFKTFLAERHGLERPLTDDRTAQKLRSLLGITSRRELNENGQAAERWKRLRGDFLEWRKAG